MTRLLYHWHYAGIGLFVVVLDGIGVGARAHVLRSQHAGNHISGLDTDGICMGLVKFPTHTPHFFIVLDTVGIQLGYGETNSVWQNFSECPTK